MASSYVPQALRAQYALFLTLSLISILILRKLELRHFIHSSNTNITFAMALL